MAIKIAFTVAFSLIALFFFLTFLLAVVMQAEASTIIFHATLMVAPVLLIHFLWKKVAPLPDRPGGAQ
jgi:hypothetical protein